MFCIGCDLPQLSERWTNACYMPLFDIKPTNAAEAEKKKALTHWCNGLTINLLALANLYHSHKWIWLESKTCLIPLLQRTKELVYRIKCHMPYRNEEMEKVLFAVGRFLSNLEDWIKC